jgi:hypothetical protein
MATKIEKLPKEQITATEDKIVEIADSLNELEIASLYMLLNSRGMTMQKAYDIRVKAGAIN